MKNVAEFPGTSKNPKAANAKNIENPGMEYMEYAVAVASHWDKGFVQKFSTKSK
jgi:isopropylmalate/homocitrate/citramalate synthase